MARARRIIYNGNQNTSVDYIPYLNGQKRWAYYNGIRIPHWVWAAKRPTSAMTSNTAPSPYVADRSSRYGPKYEAFKAFNNAIDGTYDAWVADSTDQTNPWIQLKMDTGLKSIYIVLKNRVRGSLVNGVKSATIYGSDNGSTLTQIGTISGRNGASSGLVTTHYCNNHNDSYQYVRLVVHDWDRRGQSTDRYLAVGEIEVYGKLAQ
jgi:hypothetical protein